MFIICDLCSLIPMQDFTINKKSLPALQQYSFVSWWRHMSVICLKSQRTRLFVQNLDLGKNNKKQQRVAFVGESTPVDAPHKGPVHYIDVTMTTMASQITSLAVVYSIVYSGADQRKHQSSASLAFVRGIHRDRGIPRTKDQLRENVSIWWRHHEIQNSFPWHDVIMDIRYRIHYINLSGSYPIIVRNWFWKFSL